MKLRPVLLLVAALAACAPRPALRRPAADAAPAAAAGLCRIGADGGIPVADRGIGGTGIGSGTGNLTGLDVAAGDRGIGGTGAYADRGIGGTGQRTGIVGVITGFASVCLAGQEVQYAPGQQVTVDGRPAGLDALRAGQVATVEAQGGARPVALSLSVRHEVSGPVERVEADGAVRVAGQRVLPPQGSAAPGVGSWTMVSGFHLRDGSIAATRLDPRGPGEVLIRGVMRNDRGRLWIGTTEVRPGRSQWRTTGFPVLAIGRLQGGVLEADTVEPDGLLADPEAFFGPRVGVVIFEGYAEGGFFGFGRRRLDAGFGAGRVLARLERRGGGLVPAFVGPSGPGFGAGGAGPGGLGPRFEPAPRFDRSFDRPNQGGRDGPRNQGGGRERRGERREEGGGFGPGFGAGGGGMGFGGPSRAR